LSDQQKREASKAIEEDEVEQGGIDVNDDVHVSKKVSEV